MAVSGQGVVVDVIPVAHNERRVAGRLAQRGGRLVAIACVERAGEPVTPCGRCRQLLFEHGGAGLLVDDADGPLRLGDLLPRAFGPSHLGET